MIEKYIYSKHTDYKMLHQCKSNLLRSDSIRNISYKKHLPILEEIFECL